MSKTSKRHFTVIIQNKEHGLYISSTPSSAAKKAVSKLCASNKNKKVEFHIREITRDSKKKTYGPYIGYLEKLKIPIKLKEYIIKYNPVAKLKKKTTLKKIGMRGGTKEFIKNNHDHRGLFLIEIDEDITHDTSFSTLLFNLISNSGLSSINILIYKDKKTIEFNLNSNITEEILLAFLNNQGDKDKIIEEMKKLRIKKKIRITLKIPYMVNNEVEYEEYLYMEYDPNTNSNFPANERNQPSQQQINKTNERNRPSKPQINNTNKGNRFPNLRESVDTFNRLLFKGTQTEFLNRLSLLNIALRYIVKNELLLNSLLYIFYCFLHARDDPIKNRKIISVGSGNAYFEYLLKESYGIPEIICIDPAPESFLHANTGTFIKPKFATVDDLLDNKSNEYKDSLLILNWVFPRTIDTDYGPYDVEAIQTLNPIRIFTIYEDSGTAGSESFHQNFKNEGAKKYGYKSEKKVIIPNVDLESIEYVIEYYKRNK